MLAVSDWNNLIVEPVQTMLTRIIGYLPILLGAIVILIVGWLIAKAIRRIVDWLLKTIRFDLIADKSGITEVLKKGNLKFTARELLSNLVYWLVMIMVLVLVVTALGLPTASDVLESLFAYIPNVIASLLILVVALFLSSFVSGIVRTAAGNANLPKPEILAGVSRWAIIIFAAAIALEELKIATLLVTSAFNIILGGICLALALAFGLGGKDAVAQYIAKVIAKYSEKKS